MRDATSLSDAFVEDHRHLTRGLSATLDALEKGELATAVQMANELDQRAGPHIRFEEEFFYPDVARSRGAGYVSQLHREHAAGRNALRALLKHGAAGHLTPDEKARIVAGLREALDHAVSCGTLLSHVTTLAGAKQQEYLDHLLQLRDMGGRWTERRADEDDRSG